MLGLCGRPVALRGGPSLRVGVGLLIGVGGCWFAVPVAELGAALLERDPALRAASFCSSVRGWVALAPLVQWDACRFANLALSQVPSLTGFWRA
mmetsp:Transcript_18566/g.40574  ORF Transcript_18566/g.40574 Transcript_18566/m.40574 type:complete len:94 (+) Transcript_18566:172-453(+)